MKQYILALDQGTTSSRAILFGHDGRAIASAQQEFPQILPAPGIVEHDPEAIWNSQLAVAREAIKKAAIEPAAIAAIGITNQRETTVLWERDTGKPVANAIVWQSRVSAPICDRLKADGLEKTIGEKTGLVIDAYFSGTKIKHLLDTIPGFRSRAERGEILFGTVDSFLIWRLTGGKRHVTDVTNASRTMLFNLHTLAWDDELLKLLDVPRAMLPEVRSNSEIYAETDSDMFGRPIPIAGCAGDQQAATFGQACFEIGNAKNTYGTGCFMLLNVGDKPVLSKNKLLTTVGWQIGGQTTYCLEGSVFIAGAVVQWLRDGCRSSSRAPKSKNSPLACPIPAAWFSCQHLSASGRRTGINLPAGRCSGSRAAPPRPHRAGSARIDGVSNGRRAAGDAARRRHSTGTTESRWRREREQPAHAISGRYTRRSRRPASRRRNHRAGRGLPGRPRRWILERHRRCPAQLGDRSRVPTNLSADSRQALRKNWQKAVDRALGWGR